MNKFGPVGAAAEVKRLGPVAETALEKSPVVPKALGEFAVAADEKRLAPVAGAEERLNPANGLLEAPDDDAEVLAAGALALELEPKALVPKTAFEAAASVNEAPD